MSFRASAQTPITKEYILKRVTQKKIFEHYLNITVQTKKKFKSPLRTDKNPSCEFHWSSNRLRLRDWSTGMTIDCFDLVMKLYDCSFPQALDHIADDMNLADIKPKNKAIEEWTEITKRKEAQEKSTTPIRVRLMDQFQQQEIDYLKSHGITHHQVNKYNVRPIDRVWIRDYMMWGYTEKDPALAYYFGTDEEDIQLWKIYFYKRTSGMRFACNTGKIQGYEQLPSEGDLLVITKSLKDVMALDSFNIDAIAPQGEVHSIEDEIIEDLKDRFNSIISLYDFDYAGVKGAQYLRKEYGIQPLFLTNGRYGTIDYGAKDFSDFVKHHGMQAAQELVNRHLMPKAINQQANSHEYNRTYTGMDTQIR